MKLSDYLYYQDDWCTIYHADCREILFLLPPVDLVLTDPPYGIDWNCDYASWVKHGPNAQGGDSRRSYPQVYGDDKPFDPSFLLHYKNLIIWGAPCFMKHLGNGTILIWYKRKSSFLAQAEAAWMNRGNGVYVYEEAVEAMQKERNHPTQKPFGLMKWSIEKSNTTGTILDPYMGSGTTLVAAKNLNRKAIGIEIEEKYCAIAVKRLRQEVFDFRREKKDGKDNQEIRGDGMDVPVECF